MKKSSAIGRRHIAMAAAMLLATSGAAAAQSYTGQTVATGLNNPRGLAFDSSGTLYIAEAGYFDSGVTPGTNFTIFNNGSITTLSGTTQTRAVTGLPSIYNGEDVTGPSDIAFRGGTGYVLIGLGTDPSLRPSGSGFGSLTAFTGGAKTSYDLSAYEQAFNPIDNPDSNPFHVVATASGFLATDAGGNTLLSIAAGTGVVSLVTSFADRFIAPPPYIPMGPPLSQSVPTGVVVGADGTIYVAELTGFPFTPGAARIYSIAPGSSTASIYATGLTDLTALAIGKDGALYALEYDVDGITGPGTGGALVRVGSGTSSTTVFTDGLVHPTGLAVGADGAFYVANGSEGAAGSGTVLRITAAVPEAATWAMFICGLGLAGGMLRRREGRHASALRACPA